MAKTEKLIRQGIVAVVREENDQQAFEAAKAVIKGGIKGVEITFSVPKASKVISELKEEYQQDPDVIIGAGTVLDSVTARLAIMAGADFIVSPCFDQDTASLCLLYRVPYMPGGMTVSEIYQAMKNGAKIVKLFPANNFTPQIIKAINAPLPQVKLMPTGGINLENISEWKQAGAVMVGIGGNLFKGVKDCDYERVTKTAQDYVAAWTNG